MPEQQASPELRSFDAMTQAARDAVGVWECACGIWGNYFTALAQNATPEGIIEANTRLLTEGFDVYTKAAGLLLKEGGMRAPTLNDA
jgi:hypothetical protein